MRLSISTPSIKKHLKDFFCHVSHTIAFVGPPLFCRLGQFIVLPTTYREQAT